MPPSTTNLEKLQILIALIMVFEGFNIAFLSHELTKISEWTRLIGYLMFIGGIGFFVYMYRKKVSEGKLEQLESKPKRAIRGSKARKSPVKAREDYIDKKPLDESILTRAMKDFDARTKKIFPYLLPIIGALIIDAVIIRNIMRGTAIDLGSFDLITILFGVTLIVYNFVPKQLSVARDFTVFFFGIMFFIWIFPQILGNLITEDAGAEYTSVLLAQPTGWVLSVIGIPNSVSGDLLSFDLSNGQPAGVGIGQACSGLYTATIFIALFVTFILVEYKKIDKKVIALLALGIFLVYFANILRMVTLVLIYHHYGVDAFSWAHANLGTIIFTVWLAPFMYLLYRFLMREDFTDKSDEDPQPDKVST